MSSVGGAYLFIFPGVQQRGSGTSILSPRGTLKDSPAVCWSGCRSCRYCPFKSIMAAARGNCFDGSEGRDLFPSHATQESLQDWLYYAQGRKEMCVQLFVGFSACPFLRPVGATARGHVSVIQQRQAARLKVMVEC